MHRNLVAIAVIVCLAPRTMPARGADETTQLKEVRVAEAVDGDTVRVWWNKEKVELVRYLAVNAPEMDEPFGQDAHRQNEQLVAGKTCWLELQPASDDYRRDSRKRLLAYLWQDKSSTQCVNIEMVRQGAARIDVRDVRDDTPADDFAVKHLGALLAAQLDACRARRGWWAKGDSHADSDLAIVFIKFWGKDETLYLVNRSQQPVNLCDGWQLADRGSKHKLAFASAFPTGECLLPAGGVCRVHTNQFGKLPPPASGQKEIDIGWSKRGVWNNGGDEATLTDKNGRVVYRYTYKGHGG